MNSDVQNSSTKRTRLTREELLAGHCEPASEQIPVENDPRIKRPDELLSQLTSGRKESATREIEELKARHSAEIAQWREYERQVKEWKTSVMEVVRQLKRQAAGSELLQTDIQRLKSLLLSKEEELKTLRLSLERANPDRSFWR